MSAIRVNANERGGVLIALGAYSKDLTVTEALELVEGLAAAILVARRRELNGGRR